MRTAWGSTASRRASPLCSSATRRQRAHAHETSHLDAAGQFRPCVGSRTRSVLSLQVAALVRALLLAGLLRGGLFRSRFHILWRVVQAALPRLGRPFFLYGRRHVHLLRLALVRVLMLARRNERVRKRQRHGGRAARSAFSDRAMLHR